MIKLGEIQKLEAIRPSDFGMYLSEKDNIEAESILLPRKQVPEGMAVGDEIDVFIYKDTEDRLIATTHFPKVTVGHVGVLEVVEVTRIGAFLDWGLQKDLLLPFKEQLGEVAKGDRCVVSVYVDKSERLCATMKVYNALHMNPPYSQNQTVKGTVYQIKKDFGVFVAVENQYHGLIPVQEMYGNYQVGEVIEARVKKIRPDGKLELSVRRQAFQQIEVDAKKIMTELEKRQGKMPYNDASTPAEIKSVFNMSKASFKRAIGRLFKEGAIEITPQGINKRW